MRYGGYFGGNNMFVWYWSDFNSYNNIALIDWEMATAGEASDSCFMIPPAVGIWECE